MQPTNVSHFSSNGTMASAPSLPTVAKTAKVTAAETQDALYAGGHHMLALDRYVDAAAFFRVMVLRDAGDERGWLALGHCHEETGDDDVALQMYECGIELASCKVRCLLAAARVLRRNGRPVEAERRHRDATREANGDRELWALVSAEDA